MQERYIENSYSEVYALIKTFVDILPEEDSKDITFSISLEHPEFDKVNEAFFEEGKKDLELIIKRLKSKESLSKDEAIILQEAEIMLSDIQIKFAYKSGATRSKAEYPIKHNFEHLYEMSHDSIYQKCLQFAEEKVKYLFISKYGTRAGTVEFYGALDVLISFYYYVLLLDELNAKDKKVIKERIYDIACNINRKARKYLINKDPSFKIRKRSHLH